MPDVGIRTEHACPECDGRRVYLWLTRINGTMYHPEHGTLEVAEGIYVDGDDEFRLFSNHEESGPEYICFDCGWIS